LQLCSNLINPLENCQINGLNLGQDDPKLQDVGDFNLGFGIGDYFEFICTEFDTNELINVFGSDWESDVGNCMWWCDHVVPINIGQKTQFAIVNIEDHPTEVDWWRFTIDGWGWVDQVNDFGETPIRDDIWYNLPMDPEGEYWNPSVWIMALPVDLYIDSLSFSIQGYSTEEQIIQYSAIDINEYKIYCIYDENLGIVKHFFIENNLGAKIYELYMIDQNAPETSMEINGIYTFDGWYYPDVEITFWAEDLESEVGYTEYSYDGFNWIEYADPFIIPYEGNMILYYRSIDIFGNIEETKTELLEIHPRVEQDPTVIYGTDRGPTTIDPHNAWDHSSYNVIDQVIETLFAYDLSSPDMNIIPRLASDYGTWSLDGLTYTVSLKSTGINGVPIKFHDGTNFNASAVEWNFDRLDDLINPNHPIVYLWPDGIPIIAYVEAENDFTVKFVLNRPFAALESLLCFSGLGILSPASTPSDTFIDTFTGKLVGTGPFIYDEYMPGKGIRFHSNENYWREPPKIKDLWFLIIENINDRNNALLEGNIDLLTDPMNQMLDTFENDPNIVVESGQGTTIHYLSMNNEKIDNNMRKAISYAIDYSYILQLVNAISDDSYERLKSPIPAGIKYGDLSFDVAQMDIIQARTILVDAGVCDFNVFLDDEWLDATANNPLAIYNYTYNIENYFRENLGYLLKDYLSYIGIKINMAGIPWSEVLRLMVEDSNFFDVVAFGWGADYNDPSNIVNMLLSVDSQYNVAQVNDPHLQQLLDQGYEILDPTLRGNIYNEIQRYCVEELMPWIYLFVNLQIDTYNDKLEGFQWNPMEKVYFYPISLSPRYIDNTPPTVFYDTIPDEINITYTRTSQILGEIKAYDTSNIIHVGWYSGNPDLGFSLATTYNNGDLGYGTIYFIEIILMTTTYLEKGIHNLELLILDEHMNSYIKSFTVEVNRQADLTLRGEFDYLEKEKVKISIAAQVFDLEQNFLLVPTPEVDFTVHVSIVDYNEVVKIQDEIMNYESDGFFHWDSTYTIDQLKTIFQKGIYIVHCWVEFSNTSYYIGDINIIQFHIDPPSTDELDFWVILNIINLTGLITIGLSLTVFYLRKIILRK
jgi:peptide/nickel transport system substrate-binding protein